MNPYKRIHMINVFVWLNNTPANPIAIMPGFDNSSYNKS